MKKLITAKFILRVIEKTKKIGVKDGSSYTINRRKKYMNWSNNQLQKRRRFKVEIKESRSYLATITRNLGCQDVLPEINTNIL